MNMNDLKWPAVVVIVALMGVLGGLSYMGKDPTPVLGGILAVLAAMGFGYMNNKQNETNATLATVKEQTNGGNKALLDLLNQQRQDHTAANEQHRREMANLVDQNTRTMREMAEKMATMMPVPPEAVSSVSGGGYAEKEHSHSSNL